MSIFSEIVQEFKFNIGFRRSLMSGQKALDAQAPRAGDLAPDFTLYDIEGQDSVTLSDFRGKKPVALVFGSFT
jgi:peroxiredoxin